jgi:hypothetical protein
MLNTTRGRDAAFYRWQEALHQVNLRFNNREKLLKRSDFSYGALKDSAPQHIFRGLPKLKTFLERARVTEDDYTSRRLEIAREREGAQTPEEKPSSKYESWLEWAESPEGKAVSKRAVAIGLDVASKDYGKLVSSVRAGFFKAEDVKNVAKAMLQEGLTEDYVVEKLHDLIDAETKPASQDPEPTVGEMLEQQQAAIADEPMPEGEAMEGADDGAIAPMLSREAIANMSESAYVDYEINAIQQKAQASIKQAQNAIKQYLSRTSQKPPVGIAPENMLLAKNNPSKEERRLIADYKIAKSKLLSKEQIESEKETFRHVHQRITGRKQSPDLEDLGFVIKSLTPSFPMTIDNFLRKALGNPGREFGSGSWRDTGIPAMGRKVDAKSPQPKGGKKVQMDESGSAHAGKGIGGKQPKAHRPYSSGGMPPTDVFGITITQLTRNLAKACYMDKDAWGSPETVSFLTDSARAIAGMTDTPTDPMVNFVRFLQYCTRFAQELPFMNDYQAAGTVKAMNADLTKALDEFVEKMPEELKGKPLRPAGSPGVVGIDVQFPQQYVIYS